MNQGKAQTVQNFLTPTKLLTAFRQPPKPKSNLKNYNNSVISPPRNQKQILNRSLDKQKQADSRNNQFHESKKASNAFDRYNAMGNKINQSNASHRSNTNKDDNYLYGVQNQYRNPIQRNSPADVQTEREKKASLYGSRHSKVSSARDRNIATSNVVAHSEVNYMHTKELINKLQTLKKSLEYEITNLQTVLDDTSTHLQSIDFQYEKFKTSILNYTANYLDAAFTEYKKSMDWIRYEQFQKSGINMLTEINQIIMQKEKQMQEFHYEKHGHQDFEKIEKKQAWINMSNRQIQTKMDELNLIIKDMGVIRKQCIETRPTITEERLKRYQSAVIQLAKF